MIINAWNAGFGTACCTYRTYIDELHVPQVINAYYKDDAAVAADAGVQAFAAALTHPLGSNLGNINADNQLDTRDKLSTLLAWYIALT